MRQTRAGFHDLVVGPWGARFRGRCMVCAIGRGGIVAEKREGDGGTPIGVFKLIGGTYRADRRAPPKGSPAVSAAGPRDLWSDDPDDPCYNQPVRALRHAFSHERLRRGDRLYDLTLFTDFNSDDPTAGAGSAIFVHVARAPRSPTAGCLAFSARDLEWILARWTPRSRLVVAPFRR